MGERELIINYCDVENAEIGFDEIICELKEKFKIENAEYIAIKEEHDYGYTREDSHVPNVSVHYAVVKNEDLYEYLDDLCQCEDCKNGTQIYKVGDTYQFCITGANFYDDKTNEYAGSDEVRVYLKEFVW